MSHKIESHDDWVELTTIREDGWGKVESNFLVMPSGDAQVFVECGNCNGTASDTIDRADLRALRDFLIEHVKD